MSSLIEWVTSNIQAQVILAAAVAGAILVELLTRRVGGRLAAATRTELDDEILRRIRHPLAASMVFVGVHYALASVFGGGTVLLVGDFVLVTAGAVLWASAALRVAGSIAHRTKTDVDDEIVRLIRVPVAGTAVLVGLRLLLARLELSDQTMALAQPTIVTLGVLLWTRAAIRIGKAVLGAIGRAHRFRLVEERTLPLFDIVVQMVVYLGAAYAVLLAWDVDVTAWLASAGIVGIAVGFAARDTLANLFAGIFIIADAPYKVGDFIVLDSGERGRVTNIGIRSTRILTRDDVEVTIPNAALGNAKIVNESGGPHEAERVRISVGVSYGSDIDKVRQVLIEVGRASSFLSKAEGLEPRVRFRAFGESSLDFQLLGWIDEPVLKGAAIDELLTLVYKRFAVEGIVIPFPQRDLWLRRDPAEQG